MIGMYKFSGKKPNFKYRLRTVPILVPVFVPDFLTEVPVYKNRILLWYNGCGLVQLFLFGCFFLMSLEHFISNNRWFDVSEKDSQTFRDRLYTTGMSLHLSNLFRIISRFFFFIGPLLYGFCLSGILGSISISFVQCMLFASFIVAVDPVAVRIFQ